MLRRVEPIVIHEAECPLEGWGDPLRGGGSWRTLFSADRTPTHSMTVGVAELAAGDSNGFPLHRHAQPEIYYILPGCGSLRVGEKEHSVRPGSAIFVPGGVEHGIRNTGEDMLRILYVFPACSFEEIRYEFQDG